MKLATLAAAIMLCLHADSRPPSRRPEKPPAVKRLDGSTIKAKDIERTVTRLMAAGRVTGLALAVLNDGKIAYLNAFGMRDVERKLPLTINSVMAGASFSKAVFAYTVMQLVQEGLLDLDRPVTQYLQKPLAEHESYRDLALDERYKLITARMLLSHTSGFPNWRRFNPDKKLDIKAEPGSRYMYSGEGISLLQMVVRQVSGKPTRDLIQDRVFGPLHMSRTSMVWQPEWEADHAIGYDEEGKAVGPPKRESADAAGSMATTVHDFALLLEALLRGDGLKKAARDKMLAPQIRIHSKRQFPTSSTETTKDNDDIRLSYGLGWGLFWTPYGKAYFKEGHDDGWENYSITFDEKKLAMIIMTNSSNGESIFKELLATVIRDVYTPWEWENYVPYDQP